jgi:small subunit ribosomal protein S19e
LVTVFDVPPSKIIKKTSEKLKEMPEIKAPEWMRFVKSGSDRERAPEQDDFWYTRCAALLRKVYVKSPVGVGDLKKEYGTRKHRGVKPEHRSETGGSIIRKALQQLEKAGLIEKKKEGRVMTNKGKSFLNRIAYEVSKQ